MKCVTCGADLPPKPKGQRGRQRKYCDRNCNPFIYKPKGAGLSHCQVCGKELANIKPTGRPRRNCSRLCRGRAHPKRKPAITKSCAYCKKSFESPHPQHRFCCNECRTAQQSLENKRKWQRKQENKFPNRQKTSTCGWCGEPRTFKIGESVSNAYHPECRKEAQSARYRIKTVKRQSKTKRWRISHQEIVRQYGDKCHICNKPIDLDLPRTHTQGLTVDHLVPLSKGGTDDMSNLRPAHWSCNMRKSDKLMEELNA